MAMSLRFTSDWSDIVYGYFLVTTLSFALSAMNVRSPPDAKRILTFRSAHRSR